MCAHWLNTREEVKWRMRRTTRAITALRRASSLMMATNTLRHVCMATASDPRCVRPVSLFITRRHIFRVSTMLSHAASARAISRCRHLWTTVWTRWRIFRCSRAASNQRPNVCACVKCRIRLAHRATVASRRAFCRTSLASPSQIAATNTRHALMARHTRSSCHRLMRMRTAHAPPRNRSSDVTAAADLWACSMVMEVANFHTANRVARARCCGGGWGGKRGERGERGTETSDEQESEASEQTR